MVLVVVLVTKFLAGAWITIIAMVIFFLIMRGIGNHYAMVEAELGPDHYELAALLITIAGVAARAGESRQAADAYSRALRIQRRVLGADHADVRETLGHLDALGRRW